MPYMDRAKGSLTHGGSAGPARPAEAGEGDRFAADREAVAGLEARAGGGIAREVDIFDRAAARAAEVGMIVRDGFVHRRTLTRNIEFEDVPEIVQPSEPPVDGGETDPRTQLPSPFEHILSRRMATRAVLIDDVENHTIIGRELGG